MFAEADGDALVGRTVAQLKFTQEQFDVLPLHFDKATLQKIHDVGWSNVLPGYALYPENFALKVVPFLAAAIVYHYREGHLQALLPQDHPIFTRPIIRNIELYEMLKDKVILTHEHCSDSHMHASGVPAVIATRRMVDALTKSVGTLRDKVVQDAVLRSNELKELLDRQPNMVCDALQARFRIDGSIPFTLQDVREIITQSFRETRDANSEINAKITALQQSLDCDRIRNPTDPSRRSSNSTRQGSIAFLWPGSSKFHNVPHGFRFPSDSVGAIWDLWFEGNQRFQIGPYMHISPQIDLVRQSCRVNFARAKRVVEKILSIAEDKKIIGAKSMVNRTNHHEVFDAVFPSLVSLVYQDAVPRRPSDLNMNTVSNRMQTQGATKRQKTTLK